MNLSVGYLGLVLLAVACEYALGSPMTTTSNSEGSSSDTSTTSNADVLNDVGVLTNIYEVLSEQEKGLSVCQDPFIYKGVTYCKSSDVLQLDNVSFAADSSLGCVLNRANYQHGDINRNLCMHMKCNNGEWEYTGQMNNDCEREHCKMSEDTQFWTFDDTKGLDYGHEYEFKGLGNYIITQNGMKSPSFELNADFDDCNLEHKANVSCVQSITYREHGIAVQLVLPPHHNITERKAEIMVLVNGEVQKLTNGDISAEAFSGTDGTVLVFKQNHTKEETNSLCMNIVGSQGLSVSLCQPERNFAFLSVLPMPTLKSSPSKLYGLCNTYTGLPQNSLIPREGVKDVFVDSWRSSCVEVGGRCQGIHETCNGVIDRGLGCSHQVCCIERKGCELDNIPYEEGAFNNNTCMTMQCKNGAWVYSEQIKEDCGDICTVEGLLNFLMFDYTTFLGEPNNTYSYEANGTYVITQAGLFDPSFGLNATFQTCNANTNLTCITNISYYEPGITVEVGLPNQTTDTTFPNCTRPGHNPSTDPKCQFMVKIDGKEVRQTNRAMNIHASFGSVLLFTHNHIKGDANLFCMNVVGSRGLSVSLCQHESNFSWLYVFPMPTLKPKQTLSTLKSKLHGLCNTYTGQSQEYFTQYDPFSITRVRDTRNTTTFADSWHESCEAAGGVCLFGHPIDCQGIVDTHYKCGTRLGQGDCCFKEESSEKSTQNISQEE